uniref:Uncharacterized protein n=1 Tax=Ciona savignyi TaxID=51511 RepID=H2ZN27_CIOSA
MSWHRSLRFVLNGDNPFETIRDNNFMENIQGELLHQLERELANMNIPRLQMELNSLLMSGKEMTSDWRLKDVLEAYLEGKYDDVDVSWCEHLPDDVLYKHSVHVFKISVQL